jgi:hypothetical protein
VLAQVTEADAIRPRLRVEDEHGPRRFRDDGDEVAFFHPGENGDVEGGLGGGVHAHQLVLQPE